MMFQVELFFEKFARMSGEFGEVSGMFWWYFGRISGILGWYVVLLGWCLDFLISLGSCLNYFLAVIFCWRFWFVRVVFLFVKVFEIVLIVVCLWFGGSFSKIGNWVLSLDCLSSGILVGILGCLEKWLDGVTCLLYLGEKMDNLLEITCVLVIIPVLFVFHVCLSIRLFIHEFKVSMIFPGMF